ncbi:transcriptional regulator, GntR family [Ruaniaceae bacterium KH17]|nr:transcriptional regulator, GntR family [Ruaniaceae bacterium KH17]
MPDSSNSVAKSELVYRELRSRIISGRYVAGYRLVLGQIAREMGVSPVPVREAIRRLEAEKLVTFTRNVGAEVASIDVGDYANAMETLAYLEGAATALAAPLLSKKQLADATDTNDHMRSLATQNFDPRLFTDLNQRFHKQLCIACPNDHMNELLDVEWDRVAIIRRNTFSFEPVRSQTSVSEHDHILELITTGAPAQDIEMAARKHKMRTLRAFVEDRPST